MQLLQLGFVDVWFALMAFMFPCHNREDHGGAYSGLRLLTRLYGILIFSSGSMHASSIRVVSPYFERDG